MVGHTEKYCTLYDRSRGNGFKPKDGRFRLDIRQKCFAMRVVKHWNRLPKGVANAPCLDTCQVRLEEALRNLNLWKMSLLVAGGLD